MEAEYWSPAPHTNSPLARGPSGFHLAEGAIGRPVVSGEGFELQRVEGVLPAAHILHSVLPAAALAGETRGAQSEHSCSSLQLPAEGDSRDSLIHTEKKTRKKTKTKQTANSKKQLMAKQLSVLRQSQGLQGPEEGRNKNGFCLRMTL